jgi:hypothetical protein
MTTEDRRPPTEEELDEAARALIPKLNRISDLALEEPHDFTTAPNIEHRRKLALRGGRHIDRLALTDSIEVRLTHEFVPRWCALNHDARAKADPVIAILELYPGSTGRLELYLCVGHHANLTETFRRRSLASNGPELHFAGRRILALNPRPLDVADVIKHGGAPLA